MAESLYTVHEFTASDGYCWKYRQYAPAGAPCARVVYLHGIQSHSGWYEYSCHRMAQEGFEVAFLDRRGSGMNQKERGDAPSFRRLLDDIAEFVQEFREDSLPTYLIAVSWGGKTAVALQRYRPGLFNGLALLCPGFFPKLTVPLRARLAILRSRLLSPQKLFPIPLNDPELFTANPKWQQFLRDDPLSLQEATARFLMESARLDVYLRFAGKHVDAPVLLLLGELDRIIDNNRTKQYVSGFSTPDKTIIEYPAAHHTLEFESDPGEFTGDLLRWLASQVAKSS